MDPWNELADKVQENILEDELMSELMSELFGQAPNPRPREDILEDELMSELMSEFFGQAPNPRPSFETLLSIFLTLSLEVREIFAHVLRLLPEERWGLENVFPRSSRFMIPPT